LSYNQIDDAIVEAILRRKERDNLPLRELLVYACEGIKDKTNLK